MLLETIFLSTPSARRATSINAFLGTAFTISIHALREEGDFHQCFSGHSLYHFYPRPPRGGRHLMVYDTPRDLHISIHALREEGDSKNRDKISIFKQIIQHSARI